MDEEVEDVVRVEGRNTPAEHVELGGLVLDQREMLRLRLGVEIHLHADLAEHADSRLADRLVIDVAVVRAVQRDREAVTVTRLGHQRLCGGHVIGRDLVERLVPAIHERRHDDVGRRGLVAHHDLLDGVAVDRDVHRPADADIGERVLAVDIIRLEVRLAAVHAEEDHAVLRRCDDLQPVLASDTAKVLDRNVLDEVHLTRKQRGDAGRGRLDRGVDDLACGKRELALAPVARVRLQDCFLVRNTADQHVGAGAVCVLRGESGLAGSHILRRRCVVRLGPAGIHHEQVGQVVDQQRVGAVGLHVDGMVVDLADFLDARQQLLHRRGRQHRALEAVDSVVGVEFRPVMEGHALAKGKPPDIRIVVQRFPAGGKCRRDLAGHVTMQQRLVDLVRQSVGRTLVLGMRVEGQRVARPRPAQCFRRSEAGHGHAGGQHTGAKDMVE